MATAAEFVFIKAVAVAEGVRQTAKAAAFATYGFAPANLATYITAIETADNAYITAINSALSTLGGTGITVPNAGPASQVPVVDPGGLGLAGPFGSNIATFGGTA